jgi:hypothetical protein
MTEVHEVFSGLLTELRSDVIARSQRPISTIAFGEKKASTVERSPLGSRAWAFVLGVISGGGRLQKRRTRVVRRGMRAIRSGASQPAVGEKRANLHLTIRHLTAWINTAQDPKAPGC